MKIKTKDLIALTQCSKKYELQKLSLNDRNKRYLCFSATIKIVAEHIALKTPNEIILNTVRNYLEEQYQNEWFLLHWQKEKTIQRDLELFQRFLNNFTMAETDKILVNQTFDISLALTCNEIDFDVIRGKAHIVLEHQDGSIEGIIICRKFTKSYSYLARKPDHKVHNSIELLVLMEALQNHYPRRNVQVTLIRLCAASDKTSELVRYNQKKGENSISLTDVEIKKAHPEGIKKALINLITNAELCSCKDCHFEEICKSSNQVFLAKNYFISEQKEIKFSNAQKEVINQKQGPIRVCAGPGSGKTAVLMERIRQLIRSGVAAEKILALTFTNKATDEMKQRLQLDESPQISTLHSLALNILREYEQFIEPICVAKKVDRMGILLKVLENAPIIKEVSYEGLTMPYGLLSKLLDYFEFINKFGEKEFINTYSQKDTSNILTVKNFYDDMMKERKFYTHDDIMNLVVKLFHNYPDIAEMIRDQYDYIIVDEVQDLDVVQATFVRLLTKSPEDNIMICGDSDQAIYSFRGGSNHFMLHFEEYFPNMKDFRLEDNYRSSKEIVSMASHFIENNKDRISIHPKASFSSGFQPIFIQNFSNYKIVVLISDILKKGYDFKDIAIIARTNKELLQLEEEIEKYSQMTGIKIPNESPKYYLKDDYIFQMLLDLLELRVKGMHQDKALYRLLMKLNCEVSKENLSLSLYEDHIQRGLIYRFEGEEASRYYLNMNEKGALNAAYNKIYRAFQIMNEPIHLAMDALMASFFPKELCIKAVIDEINEIIRQKKIGKWRELYETMFNIKQFDDDTRVFYSTGNQNQINLLTAHDAKGKEFPVVILFQIDEFERDNIEEDRRLLYVALTRAKKTLFITEGFFGKSQFLKEIIDDITIYKGKKYE